MEAPSQAEMHEVQSAGARAQAGDVVVHWQSAFGLVVIEVREGQTYVNGDLVEPVPAPVPGNSDHGTIKNYVPTL